MDGTERGLTRRRVIQIGGGAAVVMYFGGLTGLAAADSGPAYLRRSSYVPLVGSEFSARAAGGAAVGLTLTAVSDLVRSEREPAFVGRDDAFALAFTGPGGAGLASGIHELEVGPLGTFAAFIAPVGRSAERQDYELVGSATVARRGRQLTVDVRVGRGVVAVRATVFRDGSSTRGRRGWWPAG